jgi:catechol 2,3-dioxygenase-like lactoylglutathione lyase family enzyme
MTVELNHTIVAARDKQRSAAFLASVLGVAVGAPSGPFVPVEVDNGVTLDYDDRQPLAPQHYAFLVDDATFDAALARLADAGVEIYTDPAHHQRAGELSRRGGGRGFYFSDPNGHNMELLTRAQDPIPDQGQA